MWAACRPFLHRPRSLGILSQLPLPPCPWRPRRRRLTDASGADGKKHMYLVLDDLDKGCSVHKLDIDAAAAGTRGRLPGPPVTRMHYPTLGDDPCVAVLGSNVVGIGFGSPENNYMSRRGGVTVAFDVKTAALTVLRDLPTGQRDYFIVHLLVAVGNRIYMIETGSPEYKGEPRPNYGAMHCLKHDGEDDQDEWSWWTVFFEESSLMRWRWNDVPDWPPFRPENIMAHALHPGGRAFFVSLHYYSQTHADHRDRGTFSYDTRRRRGKWTRHGDWELPFAGPAHYDAELGAWVGLHLHIHNRDDDFYKDGYICSCDVPPLGGCGGDTPAPDWKLGKEELFTVDPERRIDAKLVPVGEGGKFCLVEILAREGVGREECLGDGDKCVLRLTTFRVKYGDDGDLTITARRPAGEYVVSRYVDMFQVQAFWM